MNALPSSARVVVVGGGIVGCSTAYHLARLGVETVLLERAKLTSGTTFHAAGLVGQLRANANITELLGYSVALYAGLEEETGLASGWKGNGGLRLACNAARWEEVRRQATTARSFGLEMSLLTPTEAQALWPPMDVGDVVGAAFLPSDGQANPSDITAALARGARTAGALVVEDCPVLDLEFASGARRDRVRAVVTEAGRIECERVVLCTGMWTRAFAARFGVDVPLVPVRHQYLVTEPIAGVTDALPTLRDPDRLTYYKEEVGGLALGGYEPDPVPWAVDGIPQGFHFTLLDGDVEHFGPTLELALGRVPALAETGVKTLVSGPESFTPDGNFILGEAPGLDGLFVGAGFNAYGIAAGGGAGMALAEWVHHAHPPFDLWPVDIRRFGRPHRDVGWTRERTLEAYAKHYAIAWPNDEMRSARPCRRSPLYAALAERGASFGEKLGWERPNWFADPERGERPVDEPAFGRPNWQDAVAREHRAARERAVLIDQSSFAKFVLKGPDAAAALDRIAANDVDRPVGTLVYTQMLNDRGGIECDLTVARTARDECYIVTGTGFATHDFDWISRALPDDARAELLDVTSAFAVLTLAGPTSRAILAAVTDDDVSPQGFPFARVRTLHVAGAPLRALRVSYVGELGWELHVPTEHALAVYERLHAAGATHGLVDAGYRAIESCRLEKGYRAWGGDIGPDHTPLEAGLGWALKPASSPIPWRGREAIARQRREGLKKRLVGFTVADPDLALHGRETILRDGEAVGWLSSGGRGHHLGLAIGYGYVRRAAGVEEAWLRAGRYALDVASRTVACELALEPPYDPGNLRPRS